MTNQPKTTQNTTAVHQIDSRTGVAYAWANRTGMRAVETPRGALQLFAASGRQVTTLIPVQGKPAWKDAKSGFTATLDGQGALELATGERLDSRDAATVLDSLVQPTQV